MAVEPGTPAGLPDAPLPRNVSSSSAPGSNPGTDPGLNPYANFYWRTIPEGYLAQQLTATGKLRFVAHEMVRPTNLIPAAVSASFGVLRNSNPQYGTNAVAFGQRFGAALVRQTSFRLFSDGLLPIAFREDPRYYRLGRGHSVGQRTKYALTRVFVGRTDSGANTPNYSAVVGRAFGAALTPAYYPANSRSSGVVFQTFGTAIAGEIGLDVLREFFPGNRF